MIQIKPGADVKNLDRRVWHLLYSILPMFDSLKIDLVITSGNDSKHSINSLHYLDCAVDVRTRDIPGDVKKQALTDAIIKVAGDDFDVILESNHIHIEYDPRANKYDAA